MKLSTQFDTEFVVKYIIAEILGMIMEYCKKYRRLQWEVIEKAKEKLTDVRSHVCIVRSFLYQQNREENWIIKKICLAPCKLVFDMPFTVKRWIRWIKCPEPIRGVCVCLCHFPLFSIQKRHKCSVVKLMRFLLNTNCISSYQTHVSFNLVILKSTSE